MSVKYISNSDAVFAACRVLTKFGSCSMGPFCPDSGCREVREVINSVPSADVVEVRHGKWSEENPDYLDGDSVYVCSVCGETWTLIEGTPLDNNMHYCPNCGAKMDGGQD